ncbi:putative Ubiquitin-like domain-containing protein [Helianthus annuus]|nr:putative Ubiquitin-like domain-containing protein [Helianthus annuus]
MASNHGGKGIVDSGSSELNNSETTVEIKIKTLDSQTYTLRVDKCVPVPALKEQIATVTGILSDQQRLICRGKVLKDDQLLSAYHVEDGHTLHLVARQPINPSLSTVPDHTAGDPASSTRHGPSVVVGTFNISDQGDGSLPDFSRIVSAVLGSFGIANAGSGGDAVDLQQHISERLSRIPGLNEIRNSTGQQPDDASGRSQPNSQSASFTIPASASMDPLQLPGNSAGEESNAAPRSTTGPGGLPTPAALSEVTQSTRQLLIEQAGVCLTQLTRQLRDQTNVTDPVARLRMQSNALRSGALLQNLGAFLLELGRTTMTLRMGQTPTEAVVNAGPAVFISTSGPNPIMVQPLPFQPGTSFGTTPTGPGTSFSSGTGLRPRNIDIRIRTGSVLSSAANQREANGGERSAAESAASDGGTSNQQAASGNVRVVPIRVSTLPPGLAASESSIGSMSVLYPVVDRNGSHHHNGENRPHLAPNRTAQQQPPEVPGTAHGRTFSTEVPSGLGQLLRSLFTSGQNNDNGFIFQGTSVETAHTAVDSQETPAVGSQETPAVGSHETPAASDEGTFLANLLHQIMPVVTQHINGGADVEDGAAQPPSSVRRLLCSFVTRNPSMDLII